MITRLDNVKLSVSKDEGELIKIAERKLGAPVKYFKILKKSLDARDKSAVHWVYSVVFSREEECEPAPRFGKISGRPRIAVVGTGPAGLVCALRLVDHGFAPVIIERGQPVERRKADCEQFFTRRVLNTQSNVQFGEGGAGAFSDGKLNTQTRDGFNRDVLKYFAAFGAPQEILYLNKPHIGSDKLFEVLRLMRAHLIEHGAEFMFGSRVDGLIASGGALRGLRVTDTATGEKSEILCDCAVLAIGHSARDTFEMLDAAGVAMEPREFAIGVRIEHLAEKISFAQYGKSFALLPAADYKLVSHAHERTVFTFCMCPGGVVIPAASEQGGVVVNGMSLYSRSGVNSNSALMVQLKREDFGGEDLFAGMRFQREIERRAFAAAGSSYKAPAQTFGDFVNDKCSSSFGEVVPSYAAGVECVPLAEVLPPVVVSALKVAVPDMAKRLKGFNDPFSVLTGVETRFSSPVRILRNSLMQSVTLSGLYPCGEGSGYSGGITSSAADGIRVAEELYKRFS